VCVCVCVCVCVRVCTAKECEACGDTKRTLMGVSVREGERERHETRATAKHGSEGVCVCVPSAVCNVMATPISLLLLLLLLLLAVREMGWQYRQGKDMGRRSPPSPVATTTTLPHDTAASHALNLTPQHSSHTPFCNLHTELCE
jgi:hypothetical protein